MKLVKARSGEEGGVDYTIRLNSGRIKSIPKGIYQQLCQIEDKRIFTEAELEIMIQQYNQTRSSLNGKIQQAAQQVQPVKNPFK